MPAGYAVGLAALVFAHSSVTSLLAGMPLAVAGESLRLWASGHLEKTLRLATGGPYAHSRNPLYVGSLLMAVGVAVASASVVVAAVAAAYWLAFYPALMREEAAFLAERFPAEYGAWSAEVPLFLPRLTPGGPRTSSFAWSRVRINREWRTAAALPLLAAVLYAQGWWRS